MKPVCKYLSYENVAYEHPKCTIRSINDMSPVYHECPFDKDNNWEGIGRDLCKYYKEKEEEGKYYLVVEGRFSSSPTLYRVQLTSPMPLEELTTKCSGLLDDPIWKEHVKIKRVDAK